MTNWKLNKQKQTNCHTNAMWSNKTPFTQNMSNGWGCHYKHWAQIKIDGPKNVGGVKQQMNYDIETKDSTKKHMFNPSLSSTGTRKRTCPLQPSTIACSLQLMVRQCIGAWIWLSNESLDRWQPKTSSCQL